MKFLPRGKGFFSIAPLWIIRDGYLWQVRKYLNPGARVVELGCAGGVAWFGKQFAMVGITITVVVKPGQPMDESVDGFPRVQLNGL